MNKRMNKQWMISMFAIPLLLTGCQTKAAPAPAATSKPLSNTSLTNTAGATANATSSANTSASGNQSGTSTQTGSTPAASTPFIIAVHQQTKVMNVTYPQFRGIANASLQNQMNNVLQQAATYHADGSSTTTGDLELYSATYAIAFEQGNVVNILIETYTMPKGAAHGMPVIASYWFNTQTGEQYTPSELFRTGSNYLSSLSQVVKADDTAGKLNTFQPFTGVTAKDGFVLQPGGLCIYFSPYEWASFADGFLAYPVPFAKLTGVINQQSPLWQALQSKDAAADNAVQAQDVAKIRSLGYTAQTASTNAHLFLSAFAAAPTASPTAQGQTLYAFTADKTGTQAKMDEEKVFFFLGNRYLGTDTAKAHGPVIAIAPDGLGSIDVKYASDQTPYQFDIQYHWSGTRLIPGSPFPTAYSGWK